MITREFEFEFELSWVKGVPVNEGEKKETGRRGSVYLGSSCCMARLAGQSQYYTSRFSLPLFPLPRIELT